MNIQWDVVVIGAGPAGMSCACTLAEQGLQVALVDEQSDPGGQIFRNITHAGAKNRFCEEKTYEKGKKLVEQFLASSVTYIPNATVWMLEPHSVFYVKDAKTFELKALRIVIAVGAMERPVPFTGWTLPGVMAGAAVDVILKGGGKLPDGPVVLAGSGPLMPLVATHLIDKGAKLAAYLDLTPPVNIVRSSAWLAPALLNTPLLLEGAKMLYKIRKHKVPVISNVESIAAHGENKVESISYKKVGKETSVATNTLFFHGGIIPRTHMARALRLAHTWDNRQQCYTAQFDMYGASSLPHVFVIGDCARVYGEAVSSLRGILAAYKIALSFDVIKNNTFIAKTKKYKLQLLHALAPRNFIDSYFAPRKNLFDMPDDVIVCRCENITAGEIRRTSKEGLADVNEIKLRTRMGMGTCQGRTCGAAAAAIAANARNVSIESMGALSVRNPVRAIPSETILTLEDLEAKQSLAR